MVGLGFVHGHLVPKAMLLSLSQVTHLEGGQARLRLEAQGEGQHRGWGVRDVNYSVENKKATGIYCTAQGIEPIFYNNFKYSIIYKNFESLCCTPET